MPIIRTRWRLLSSFLTEFDSRDDSPRPTRCRFLESIVWTLVNSDWELTPASPPFHASEAFWHLFRIKKWSWSKLRRECLDLVGMWSSRLPMVPEQWWFVSGSKKTLGSKLFVLSKDSVRFCLMSLKLALHLSIDEYSVWFIIVTRRFTLVHFYWRWPNLLSLQETDLIHWVVNVELLFYQWVELFRSCEWTITPTEICWLYFSRYSISCSFTKRLQTTSRSWPTFPVVFYQADRRRSTALKATRLWTSSNRLPLPNSASVVPKCFLFTTMRRNRVMQCLSVSPWNSIQFSELSILLEII